MKHIFTLLNQTIRKSLLLACALLAMSGNAWGGKGDITFYATAAASPSIGGTATVSPAYQTKTSGSFMGIYGTVSATFSYSASANSGFTFKGWSTNSADNTGTNKNPMSKEYSGKGNRAGNATKHADTYYAIFAGIVNTASTPAASTSLAFGEQNVDGSKEMNLVFRHAHAGKISSSITGTNASEFTLKSGTSLPTNSTTLANCTITVVFKPTCAGNRSATLKLTGSNGGSMTVNLSGTGTRNTQSLSWNNESNIETSMLKGSTQTISATSTEGTVTYSSNATSVLSVNATTGELTAKGLGTATITATAAATCTYAEASITKTFTVKSKDTPYFTPNGFTEGSTCSLKVGDKVTLTVSNVSEGLNGDFTASATQDNGKNILSITRSGNTITIEAINAGNSTATFTQKANSTIFGETKNYSFSVSKHETEFTGSAYNLMVDGTQTADYTYTNTSAAQPTANSADDFYYTIDEVNFTNVEKNKGNDLVTFDPATKTITACNAGTAKITLHQKETYKYIGATASFNVTVNKLANSIKVKGSQNYSSTIYTDSKDEGLVLTADNTDYTNCPFTITQTEREDVATLAYNKSTHMGVVTSNYLLGTATWSMEQDENYKYARATGTFSVTVQQQPETTCYVLNETQQQSGGNSWDKTYNLAGPGKAISIEAKSDTWLTTAKLTITGYSSDNTEKVLLNGQSLGSSYDTYTCSVPDGFVCTKIKVALDKGSNSKYFKNLTVTRATYLNAAMSSTSFTKDDAGNDIYRNVEGHQTLNVKWSIANGGDLHIVSTNSKFTIPADKQVLSASDCSADSKDITITYKSADAGTDYGQIIVYNRVFRKVIDVTGVTVKQRQSIIWNTAENTIPVGYEFNVTTSQGQAVTFTHTSNPDVIEILNGGTALNVKGAGEATVTAYGAETDEFYEVEDSRTFTVTNDLIQRIIWNQNLLNLKVGGDNMTLNAYATQDEEGDFPTRPITYESEDESKVTVNGNVLTIVGIGDTYIIARQAGGDDGAGHKFAPAVLRKKVVVRDPNATCYNAVFQQEGEEELFAISTSDITGNEYTLSGEPEFLSVDLKRKYYKVPAIGWLIDLFGGQSHISSGGIILDQFVNNQWVIAHEFKENQIPVTDNGDQSQSFNNIKLNRNATKIRFRTSGRGGGYHYVSNCEVTLARYIETAVNEHDFGTVNVGSPREFTTRLSYNNIQDALTLTTDNTAYTVSPAYVDGGCGENGTIDITVTYNPSDAAENDNATLTITDDKTSHTVSLFASATKVTRVIHWDREDATSTKTFRPVNLDAYVTTTYGEPAGDVTYAITTSNGEATSDYEINDGVLRFSEPGEYKITAQAAETNLYNAAEDVVKIFTVALSQDFIFTGVDGNWNTHENWEIGHTPISSSDVYIQEDVVLTSEATVNSLTIEPGRTLIIADGGNLTIGDGDTDTENRTILGNIIVEAGGKLNMNGGAVDINDFTLYSGFDGQKNPKSGQVYGQENLTAHGEAYFILDLDTVGADIYGWYGITVPFCVNATTGITRYENGGWQTLTREEHYSVMAYHEDLRAEGKYGWKREAGILQPSTGYFFAGDNSTIRYRFQKADKQAFTDNSTHNLTATGNSIMDKGWNCVGNGTMSYVTYDNNAPAYVQMFNHALGEYLGVTSNNTFVVGAAYFVQAGATGTLSMLETAGNRNANGLKRAPQHEQEETATGINLTLSRNGQLNDNMFVTCNDDAQPTYTIGKDVLKMGSTTGTKVARMWANTKNAKLLAADIAYSSDQAVIPMGLYAPNAGEYTLAIDNTPEQDVYLTHDGIIVWNLSMSEYVLDLNAGTDESYALLVIRRNHNTATGIDAVDTDKRGTDFVEKMIVNGQLFILRDGILYDAQGKKVTNL